MVCALQEAFASVQTGNNRTALEQNSKGVAMVDLELTRLCAEAMGYPDIRILDHLVTCKIDGLQKAWMPLTDDAQAMALVKRFKLNIGALQSTWKIFRIPDRKSHSCYEADDKDLNRAIVECVAKMHDETDFVESLKNRDGL
jgi:hypothetical protein